MSKIKKNTYADKREIISNSLRSEYAAEDNSSYLYLDDMDDSYVYFEVYSWEYDNKTCWKLAYTYDGTKATFSGEPTEVVRLTEYKEVTQEAAMTEKSLTSLITNVLSKCFGDVKGKDIPIVKQFQDEQMIAVEYLYVTADTLDLVGDTLDEEGVTSLVKSVNDGIEAKTLKHNYFHAFDTEDFHLTKAWINPYPCVIGETEIPAGTPLAEVQYVSKAAWDKRKSGELMGLSIEGTCDQEDY